MGLINNKKTVLILIIAIQILIAISFTGFFACKVCRPPDFLEYIGPRFVMLMVVASGPINFPGMSTFPVFCIISFIFCALLAVIAVRKSSYLLALIFVLAWWASGISGLIYAV